MRSVLLLTTQQAPRRVAFGELQAQFEIIQRRTNLCAGVCKGSPESTSCSSNVLADFKHTGSGGELVIFCNGVW